MNKQPTIFILGVLLLFAIQSKSQSSQDLVKANRIGVKAGFNSYPVTIKNIEKIRANISYFDSNSQKVSGSLNKLYTGVNYQRTSKSEKFAISGGIQYVFSTSTIGAGSSSTFFYFLINNEGTTTEYLRVEEIQQNINYIGIPMEAKYYLTGYDFIKIYGKIGIDFSYAIKSQINAKFFDQSINTRESEINEKFSNESSFVSTISPAGGLEIGNKNKASLYVELSASSFFISKKVSALVTPEIATGIQVGLQIPL